MFTHPFSFSPSTFFYPSREQIVTVIKLFFILSFLLEFWMNNPLSREKYDTVPLIEISRVTVYYMRHWSPTWMSYSMWRSWELSKVLIQTSASRGGKECEWVWLKIEWVIVELLRKPLVRSARILFELNRAKIEFGRDTAHTHMQTPKWVNFTRSTQCVKL